MTGAREAPELPPPEQPGVDHRRVPMASRGGRGVFIGRELPPRAGFDVAGEVEKRERVFVDGPGIPGEHREAFAPLAASGGVSARKHQERGRHVKIQLDGLIVSFSRGRSPLDQLVRHRKLLDHSFGEQMPSVFQRDVAGRKIGDQREDCFIAPDHLPAASKLEGVHRGTQVPKMRRMEGVQADRARHVLGFE